MTFIDKYNKIDAVHQRIKMKATGTPDDLAMHIQKSRRCIYNIIDELKDMGAKIFYNKNRQSFEYLNNFEINLKIEGNEIKGGYKKLSNFYWRAGIMHDEFVTLQQITKNRLQRSL